MNKQNDNDKPNDKQKFNDIKNIRQQDLKSVYQQRIDRLKVLCESSLFAQYLSLIECITNLQTRVLDEIALDPSKVTSLELGDFDHVRLTFKDDWLKVLLYMLDNFMVQYNQANYLVDDEKESLVLDQVLELKSAPFSYYDDLINKFTDYAFNEISEIERIFLWSSLSVVLGQAVRLKEFDDNEAEFSSILAEDQKHCPICRFPSIAGEFLTGQASGLRYMHCSLCETQWHLVRGHCSNCGRGDEVHDFVLIPSEDSDNIDIPKVVDIKIEACKSCKSYIKIINHQGQSGMDVIADDLTSRNIDVLVQEEGFTSTCVNPYAM